MEEDVSDPVMLQDPPPDGGGGSSVFGIPPAVGFQGGTPGSNPSPNAAGHSLYDRVRTSAVTSSNDALDILSDAARLHHPQDMPTTSGPLSTGTSVQQAPSQTNPGVTPGGFNGLGFTITRLSQPEDPTLDLWDKCRFVRQGWFTAQEAVTYIDLFFLKLAPLSPVIVDQFRPHAAHERLVNEEAMLCCTLLMISSRFFMLPGSGGTSRSHYVHQRLWNHCEVLIRRILLGQEKTSTSKTRSVGTVESLMLISDWHPRAIHLPPETDGWDGMLISPAYDPSHRKGTDTEEPLIRWREDVFNPAERANRMSWMLLGMATNLAYELGVFSAQKPQQSRTFDSSEASLRKSRAQKVLYTYVTQTATRLSYPPPFPESISLASSRVSSAGMGHIGHDEWVAYMSMSLELTQLSRTASSLFFQSSEHLQNQVLGDHYADLLDHFFLSLSNWQQRASSLNQDTHSCLHDTLLIEFHHLKACAAAVSIQAVVARAASSGFGASNNTEDVFSAFITPKDARFLQDVISSSKSVLHLATMTDFKTQLPYAPARIKVSVISASVFLLKALSVGSTNTDVHAALQTLDQCTATLKSSPPDDMDFALRYGALIERHTAQFRAHLTFTRTPANGEPSSRASLANLGQGTDALMPTLGQPSGPDFGGMDLGSEGDMWVALPFDSGLAPFSSGSDQLSLGLDVDSLNFLWSLGSLPMDVEGQGMM
ncbi:hypothetical protein F5X68DRAFT_178076 [Plectosphaerella plurivora]|uniref:Transcription factor domain-containing protein n=1 Tax=Plectosphaerella plurivora TaxID=936078 RepID=A0A9P9A3H3_9PEZI|nr:hypothetical protein F5X68DRAFT_178076 [Plectosphaerella plurivora]